MYDFICMCPPSCEEREASQKNQNENICLHRESNHSVTLRFQSAFDHWATLTVDKLWFKLFHGMCIKLTRVTKHISN